MMLCKHCRDESSGKWTTSFGIAERRLQTSFSGAGTPLTFLVVLPRNLTPKIQPCGIDKHNRSSTQGYAAVPRLVSSTTEYYVSRPTTPGVEKYSLISTFSQAVRLALRHHLRLFYYRTAPWEVGTVVRQPREQTPLCSIDLISVCVASVGQERQSVGMTGSRVRSCWRRYGR